MNYYNENDPKAAAWLRELIRCGHIADGHVDERSICDVRPDDLLEFVQVHLFAGIGGWSCALRLAGWPDDRPVWTASCPCQPFSGAGKGLAEKDARHLWPVARALIDARKPATVFGEQVASFEHGMTRGILLVSCGDTIAFANLCIKSIQQQSELPVHLHIDDTKPGIQSRAVKLAMDTLSPFDETLFLDCDTLVMTDPTPLFDLLQHAPLWMAMDVGPRTVSEVLEHPYFKRHCSQAAVRALQALARRRPHALHFNSGVVLFDRRSSKFFDAWRHAWASLPPGPDQLALMLASDRTNTRPSLLSPRWNFQHSYSKPESDLVTCRADVRILHLAGKQKHLLYQRAEAAGYW